MKKLLLSTLFLLGSFHCLSQRIPAYSSEQVIQRTSSEDTIYIINFWATWCAPCVHELPEFNNIYERYKTKPVKIILVSLDFKDSYPDKLAVFLERKHILPDVAWLNETDPNIFIPRIDENWEGSIPATLIAIPGRYRKFVEGEVTAGQLARLVDGLLEK